ncbi:hypothetical protein PFISCL1PPCAC_14519, partial [Pristionchus fissidentatus]
GFDPVCPISIPLCVVDADCGYSGYCNHTSSSNSNYFGCCQFGPAPSEGPLPFPDPMKTPAPHGIDACPAAITPCVTNNDCVPTDYCDHQLSQSDYFGCCHSGSGPSTSVPLPFPDPMNTPPPL